MTTISWRVYPLDNHRASSPIFVTVPVADGDLFKIGEIRDALLHLRNAGYRVTRVTRRTSTPDLTAVDDALTQTPELTPF